MTRYDPEPVLAELKPFQRDTVEHVVNRFYRDSKTTRRFLVADETGLGKSIVAKGVIARTIERLQDDRKTKRIDIVYVCSNADIARQNLSRLDVVGNAGRAINSRLTLLAKYSRRLATTPHTGRKPVNLVAFTPGTSFDRGHRTGQAEERALLVLVLESVLQLDARGRKAARRMLRGNVKSQPGFDKRVERLRTELDGPIDPAILSEFIKLLTPELKARVTSCLAAIGGKEKLATDIIHEALQLTGELRGLLAEASVQTLEPDLVILDEFQRFRHLLDIDDDNPSAELAHHLFDYGDTKVLLLSATPYKPFTLAEETDAGDDHHKDLRRVLEFLEPDEVWQASVETAFQDYRQALLLGTDASIAAMAIRTLLLRAMVRTERPRLGQDGMLREITLEAGPVTPADLRGWVALAALGRKLGAKAPLDYWKSAPYFVNFMDSYQTQIRE